MIETFQEDGEKQGKADVRQAMAELALRLNQEAIDNLNSTGVELLHHHFNGILTILNSSVLRDEPTTQGVADTDSAPQVAGDLDAIELELEEIIDSTPINDESEAPKEVVELESATAEEKVEMEISDQGLNFLKRIYGDLDGITISESQFIDLSQHLYRLRYGENNTRKNGISIDQFNTLIVGMFAGVSGANISAQLGKAPGYASVFYTHLKRDIKKNLGETGREELIDVLGVEGVEHSAEVEIAPTNKDVDASEETILSPRATFRRVSDREEPTLVDQTDLPYSPAVLNGLRNKVRQIAKVRFHKRVDMFPTDYTDDDMVELIVEAMKGRVEPALRYELANNYAAGKVRLSDNNERHVANNIAHWIAEGLVRDMEPLAESIQELSVDQVVNLRPETQPAPKPRQFKFDAEKYHAGHWESAKQVILEQLEAVVGMTPVQADALNTRASYDEKDRHHLICSDDTKAALEQLHRRYMSEYQRFDDGQEASMVQALRDLTSPLDPKNIDQITKELRKKQRLAERDVEALLWTAIRRLSQAEY